MYTPSSNAAVVSMNDCPAESAVITESQHTVQALQLAAGLVYVPAGSAPRLARYAMTRAFSARLTSRNVAGVLNPVNPGPGSKTKAAPAASRCVRAESSFSDTCLYAESLETNGASGWSIERFTSMGIESWMCAFRTIRNASAWIVG